MTDSGLKARVDRLIEGDFRVDDLTRLFLFARDHCDGREAIKEVGDFVAHHQERTKGIVTREVRDWFITSRQIGSVFEHPLRADRLPSDFKDFLSASLRRADLKFGWSQKNLKLSTARKMLPEILKKFVVNYDGSLSISSNHSQNERDLINDLSTHLTIRPAFSEERLFSEFKETLRSNQLLLKGQFINFDMLAPHVTLYAITMMHNCVVQIGNGESCKLIASTNGSEDRLFVNMVMSSSDEESTDFSSSIFTAKMRPDACCDASLLSVSRVWNFDLEISSDKKLTRLG